MNTTDYDRIEAAIRYLARHRKRQPELAELAAHIGLSQSHLHRLFSRWPRRPVPTKIKTEK